MKNNKLIIFLISTLLFSCGKRIEMPENEKEWNPYKVGEVLIFRSSDNELDTIKVKKITDNMFPDGPGPLKYYNESLWVFVEHTDPNYDRHLRNSFLEIETGTPEHPTTISFRLLAKNAVFYHRNRTLDELNSMKQITLETPFGKFSDVLEINDTERRYSKRSKFVEKIYWSKSNGYLKFIKKDGKTWELIKKYVP